MSDHTSELQRTPPRGWMKGASAPLRGALLGLVLEAPAGAGVLTTRLRSRLGEAWKVDRRDVYRLLEGLKREGLVRCVNEPRRGEAESMQMVFHPTGLTERSLSDWMASAIPREPVRRGIEAKLAIAGEQDLGSVRRSLRAYLAECLTLAQTLPPAEQQPRSFTALLVDCARDGMLRGLQAEVSWAERTLRRIEEYGQREE